MHSVRSVNPCFCATPSSDCSKKASSARSRGDNGTGGHGAQTGTLAVDLDSTPDHFVIRTMLPGVKPDDVDITCHESTVTIQATVPPIEHDTNVTPLVRELGVGTFARVPAFARPD